MNHVLFYIGAFRCAPIVYVEENICNQDNTDITLSFPLVTFDLKQAFPYFIPIKIWLIQAKPNIFQNILLLFAY